MHHGVGDQHHSIAGPRLRHAVGCFGIERDHAVDEVQDVSGVDLVRDLALHRTILGLDPQTPSFELREGEDHVRKWLVVHIFASLRLLVEQHRDGGEDARRRRSAHERRESAGASGKSMSISPQACHPSMSEAPTTNERP